MSKLLYFSTYGSDDPTRASLPFHLANGAVEAGHQAQITLIGEAVYLMKDVVADAIQPVGWPPLTELLATAIQNGTPIYV